MTWLTDEDNSSRTVAQRLGLQLLMLLLCFYFNYSGASELEIAAGLSRKFQGHVWLSKIMGIAEITGGLALLDPDGALVGASILTLVMACALLSSIAHEQMYAAFESLLMFNLCGMIAMWRKSKLVLPQ